VTADVACSNGLELALAGLSDDKPLIYSFDRPIAGRELDASSDAFAAALASWGVARGDRVVLQLQNVPEFAVAMLGAWKLGAVAVPANPMYRARELGYILRDSGAAALLVLDQLAGDANEAAEGTRARVVTTSELAEISAAFDGEPCPRAELGGDDLAFLVYTSGTTGPPKGAMVLHRNVVAQTEMFASALRLTKDDVILAVAPLFHITGLILHLCLGLALRAPVVLADRFEPGAMLRLVESRKATYAIGSITAYIAMMNHPDFGDADLSSLRTVYSGGAPVAPAVVERWRSLAGSYIHNAYGLTEATSATHVTPLGSEAPVDPTSGALSIGKLIGSTQAKVVGEDGAELPTGEIGEIVVKGPQVVAGYWQNPGETAHAIRDGWLYTGDVGFTDEDGWFFLVDRSKDLIVASGYKVWPREVEDVLYEHPAVREAAVVGVPDDYRGETVKAFVSLRPGETVQADELVAFCRKRIAAFKVPRLVEFLDDLPKTVTGKILRRELRGGEWSGHEPAP
jgi:long-chain acyl-CoA synthetase